MQKAVELQCGGLTLRGMAHIPGDGREKCPFVAMYHGYTGQRMESGFMMVRLSKELERIGIGSVRFDFSGSGESDGEFEDLKVSREIEEAKCIFKFMKGLECADSDNLFMLGMSMGGFVASVASGEVDGVKALVLWAPAGNMAEIGKNAVEANKATIDEKSRVDIGGLLLKTSFVDDVASIDVYARSAKYRGKVLLVHGTGDNTVPVAASHRYKEVYGDRAELVEIEGADHCFNRIPWRNKLVETTKRFIAENV